MEKFPDLQDRLEDMLSPERLSLLKTVVDQAGALGLSLYIVGGVVRDLLLGQPAMDFDLVTEGDAIQLARALEKKHGGKVTVHPRFRTARWFLPESITTASTGFSALDLVSTRAETYPHPAALPTVRLGSLEDDLRRRDFTINTLALRLDGDHFGELQDVLGGLEDLQHKLLRCLHPQSFIEDPTRLFRLIRYEQRYGFSIATETLQLIPPALAGIHLLSAERVRHELDLVLEEERASAMLERLAGLKILATVHPALEWNEATRERFMHAGQAAQGHAYPHSRNLLGWSLWLMDVPKNRLTAIDQRLHFKAHTRKIIQSASVLLADLDSLSGKKPSRYVARLDKTPLAAVRSVYLSLPPGRARQDLFTYLEAWRHIKPKTNGDDLRARGLPPGPAYQTILRALRDAWLDGKVKTVPEEKSLLEKMIPQGKQH